MIISSKVGAHLQKSTASLCEEYRISRQRVLHLSAESTSSLDKEYFISW
ncbi:MAG: hypothetical protein LBB43_05720 [Spirochaetaceae bacterium]|nr:hypothetical protein [Spirochaetaceae bacterium]